MRLNAYITRAGLASRRGADELIKAGRVTVNGEQGQLNTFVEPHDRVAVDGEPVDAPERVVPVGRLDADTTGALLLTNDGPLAHRLAHPRYGVEKVYVADVEGEPDEAALRALAEGVELEDGMTAPATVRCLAPSRIELVLHEGRNRQVRRMLEAVGHPVRRLHRSVYAGLTLKGLELGAWRELEPFEVNRLMDL